MGTYSVASSLLIKIGIKLGNYFSPILINRLLASQLTTTVGALHPLPLYKLLGCHYETFQKQNKQFYWLHTILLHFFIYNNSTILIHKWIAGALA